MALEPFRDQLEGVVVESTYNWYWLVDGMFNSPNLIFMAKNNIGVIQLLKKIITDIEKNVKSQIKLRKEFAMLITIPGIGDILGLTIMLEVDDINRFPKVGDYSSYSRYVKSERFSNGKIKDEDMLFR